MKARKRRRRQRDRAVGSAAAAAMVFAAVAPAWAQEIRTPAAPATPRVNGPSVFGVRPGSPLFYKIAATGNGTITYSVTGLPAGLSVNSSTALITGSVQTAGDYPVTLA